MEYLSTIIKTLLVSDVEKWLLYRSSFKHSFLNLDHNYDATIEYLDSYYSQYASMPSTSTILNLVSLKGLNDVANYIKNIIENKSINTVKNEKEYIVFLEESKISSIHHKTFKYIENLNGSFSTTPQTEDRLKSFLESNFNSLVSIRDAISPENRATEYLLYDQLGVDTFKKQYDKILEKKERGEELNFPVPFECFNSVALKPGDLFITGGYTSHGKSVFLRYLTYYFATKYGKNCIFFTLEMEAETTLTLFYLLHANNKLLFPNTPKISYTRYKKGLLTDDESDFLHNTVVPDFCNNQSYGTLKVYKPNKSKFNLEDLKVVISETQLVMPVDVLSVDYLSLMNPLSRSSKSSPQTDDYNQMIKDFKQLLLTNLDPKGSKHPIIGLTAAQISRQGYNNCLKQNKVYSSDAFSLYNELERSADILMTILRDSELTKDKKVKLQFLKNRDGEIPLEPKDFMCNMDEGQQIIDAREQVDLDMDEILKELTL